MPARRRKIFDAVEHPEPDLPERGPAVRRHLEEERRAVALQDRRLQEPGRPERREEAEDVEAEHRGRARPEERSEERPLRNEGRDDERVDGQARRARHERRDQDRRDAVALVLDRPRRHDGRNRAGVRREERQERLPLQAGLAHRAVRDERRAREVARVLEEADEEEEEQDLRKEHEDGSDAAPHAFDERGSRNAAAGSSAPTQAPDARTAASTRSMRGRAAEKIVWKTATTTARKMSGPATGWRKTASRRRVQSGGAGAA